jgi:homoserine O-acetyltransferase
MAPTASADVKTFVTGDFRLQGGAVLPTVTISYRALGVLAPNRDNVVLVTHGNTTARR